MASDATIPDDENSDLIESVVDSQEEDGKGATDERQDFIKILTEAAQVAESQTTMATELSESAVGIAATTDLTSSNEI